MVKQYYDVRISKDKRVVYPKVKPRIPRGTTFSESDRRRAIKRVKFYLSIFDSIGKRRYAVIRSRPISEVGSYWTWHKQPIVWQGKTKK